MRPIEDEVANAGAVLAILAKANTAKASASLLRIKEHMPNRPCAEPRCPDLAAPKGRGRCQRHARQRDKQINRAGRSIYNTKRWRFLRRRKLFLNPLCEYVDPDEGPCMEVATDVHHKSGVENNPWDIKGLEALCHAHHSQVTRQRQLTG